MIPSDSTTRRLVSGDSALLESMNELFADAFADAETYAGAKPGEAYLEGLLNKEHFIAIAAMTDGNVVGGLVAYELDKAERKRREIYLYDLAVRAEHRRKGVATALIANLQSVALNRGAWVIFVQADYGDDPAIKLYEKLGAREEVLHFDILPQQRSPG